MIRTIRSIAIAGLLLYLPLSAWLVSLTAQPGMALVRDGLWLLAILCTLALGATSSRVPATKTLRILVGAVLAYALVSTMTLLWVDGSLAQGIKGWRFMVPPVLLLAAIVWIPLDQRERRVISWSAIVALFLVILPALLEVIGLPLPVLTNTTSMAPGLLSANHKVGALALERIQGIASGPNSLGLAVVAGASLLIAAGAELRLRWYVYVGVCSTLAAIAVVTFSRAAWIGIAVAAGYALLLWVSTRIGRVAAVILGAVMLMAPLVALPRLLQHPTKEQLLLHADSTSLRVEQYQRIWETKSEIGITGRGIGTAGPASQYRVDGGPNRWTENVYLDVFEEVGAVGVAAFILIWVAVLIFLVRSKTPAARYMVGSVAALLLSGAMVHLGTGQIAYWFVVIAIGLMICRLRDDISM
jgi:hypothetical protein